MQIDQVLQERNRQQLSEFDFLNKWALRVRISLGKCSVILFGSYARGDFNLWSDLDLVIISDFFQGVRFLERPYKLPEIIRSTDLICWTPSEFEKSLNKPGWKTALKNSKFIIDDYSLEDFLKKVSG